MTALAIATHALAAAIGGCIVAVLMARRRRRPVPTEAQYDPMS